MKTYIKYYFALIFLYLLFKEKVEDYYTKLIIDPFLSAVNASYLIDILLVVALFLYIYYSFVPKIRRNYYIKPAHFISVITLLVGYIYYRFNPAYEFVSFNFTDYIKYFDVICVGIICTIALFVNHIYRQKSKKEISVGFIEDSEISKIEEDILSRSSLAENVYRQIININSKKSFSIGITGEWGSGKTSFINLIKELVKKDKENHNDLIVCDFNPWLNTNTNSIVQDFFDTIESEISKFSMDISKDIHRYGESVSNFDGSGNVKAFLESLNILKKSNLTKDFTELNALIKKLDKKIVVFIDDVDRLQSTEIMDVLKLIRNTAGFDCFIYVVAFDKDYLVESLSSINIPKAVKYSEKIFVTEIKLLPMTLVQKTDLLQQILVKFLPQSEQEILEILADKRSVLKSQNYKIFVNPLENIRDIKRFSNLFIVNFSKIEHDIVFKEYLALQLLKYRYYEIYLLMFNQSSSFFTSYSQQVKYSTQTKIVLKLEKDENGYGSIINEFSKSKLKLYLQNERNNFSASDIINIGNLIDALLPRYNSYVSKLSMIYSINYFKYFREEISEFDLSLDEFTENFRLPVDELKNRISIWNTQNKIEKVRFHFYLTDIKEINSREEYEKLVECSFYIGNLYTTDQRASDGFNLNHLWTITIYEAKTVSSLFYQNDTDKLKSFLTNILSPKGKPSLFDLEFGMFALNLNIEDNYIFNRNELIEILVQHFAEYVKSSDSFTGDFWSYYRGCRISYDNNSHTLHSKAKELFKEFMIKDLDSVLINLFSTQSFYNRNSKNNKIGLYESMIIAVFGSYDSFEKFLNSKKTQESLIKPTFFLPEFLNFLQDLKGCDYKQMVPDEKITFPALVRRLEELSHK